MSGDMGSMAMQFGKGCIPVDPKLLSRIQAVSMNATEQSVIVRLGISYNTWRKLKGGQPLRATLLHRLIHRLENMEMSPQG